VTYRAHLEPSAIRQVHGLPEGALDEIVRLMARVCEDPYDMVLSAPFKDAEPSNRVADVGGRGFVEFQVDEAAGLVRVYAVAWIG
jgi:hypothetical protein